MPSTCMHYGHILFYVCANLGISFFPIGEFVGDYLTSPVTDDNDCLEGFYYMNGYRCIGKSVIWFPKFAKNIPSLFLYRPVTMKDLPIYHLFWLVESEGKCYWRRMITVKKQASDNIYSRSFWLPLLENQAYHENPDDYLYGYHFHLALSMILQDPENYPEDRFAQMVITENGSKVDFF